MINFILHGHFTYIQEGFQCQRSLSQCQQVADFYRSGESDPMMIVTSRHNGDKSFQCLLYM